MTARIVVGWDGGEAAREALDWALRHEPGCRTVELVSATGRGRRGADPAAVAEAAAAQHPDCTITTSTVAGPAVSVLVGRSDPETLVVLGARDPAARGGHRSSTAYRIASVARGPVAVVPQGFDHGRDVVLGVADRSDAEVVALTAARQAADRRQRLVLLHAWRRFLDLDTLADPVHASLPDPADVRVLEEVERVVRRERPDLPVITKVVHGRPIDVVLAGSSRAALLVLGRDAAGAQRRGRAVTHTALLSSRVPVLVVPPGSVA